MPVCILPLRHVGGAGPLQPLGPSQYSDADWSPGKHNPSISPKTIHSGAFRGLVGSFCSAEHKRACFGHLDDESIEGLWDRMRI